MKSVLEPPKNTEADHSHPLPRDPACDREIVLRELDNILSSRYFRSADRSKEFLRHVVLSKLDGHTERLKERAIGTEVFRRPPGYATGDDPVVRVQAGEVRRRLEDYYRTAEQPSPMRIELPVGAYAPVFHPCPAPCGPKAPPYPRTPAAPASRRSLLLKVTVPLAATLLAAFTVVALFRSSDRSAHATGALEQFWGPAISSHQPILVCIANASSDSSEQDAVGSPQPDSGLPRIDSSNVEGSLPGQNKNREIVPAADASVAFLLSGVFAKFDKPSQLRIGGSSTFEDLRNSPAAIIGGFNNKWTMQLISNLHFAFVRENGQYVIREQVPGGRVWTTRMGPHGENVEDFAIVGRLIDSKTGQFTVTVAGIGPRGTQAAGEFVSSPRLLQQGLAKAPSAWLERNLEVLLQTTVTDSVAGPPRVIATYSW